MTTLRDITAENILKRLSDLENYPDETLSPYEEFSVEGRTYYFTPDGFLYRKETPEAEEVGASCAATSPTRFGATEPTSDSGARFGR